MRVCVFIAVVNCSSTSELPKSWLQHLNVRNGILEKLKPDFQNARNVNKPEASFELHTQGRNLTPGVKLAPRGKVFSRDEVIPQSLRTFVGPFILPNIT
jgi:hypothetical protein